jgi:hypothetical protein
LGALGAAGRGALLAAPDRGMACIFIRQSGGCSHLDTFDMKPAAPRDIRGEFRGIPTSVPGLHVCEHLPLTARQAHRFTILRSMCSGESNHERAAHLLTTGWRLSPGRSYPQISELAGEGRVVRSAFPRASAQRLAERYGGTLLGRDCLQARRRVETGERFVFVDGRPFAYDTHADGFRTLRDSVLPEFDRAFSALLEDLDQRGLLATTLVVVAGEFGRTPRVNAQGGRDHHAAAWSILLAGAGLPGGRVLGATDRYGDEVTDTPVRPEDLASTICSILGARPAPGQLAAMPAGRVVRELLT